MEPPGTLQDPTEPLLCDGKEHGPVLGNRPLKRGQPGWGQGLEGSVLVEGLVLEADAVRLPSGWGRVGRTAVMGAGADRMSLPSPGQV